MCRYCEKLAFPMRKKFPFSFICHSDTLSYGLQMGLMKKHPSIIPFMIYITNEDKHLERFAVRAKYMTLDPAKNKYVKYIRNIRTIQEYLCKRADKHLVPKVNNTNVDKSVAAIHATVFSCLRRRETGEQLYDPATNTVSVVDEEYRNQCAANSLSSKGMFQLIQRQGSSRHLMALLNTDGSVAKAWPVNSIDCHGQRRLGESTEEGIGTPMYGPLQIGRSEPVNLQFGHFGSVLGPMISVAQVMPAVLMSPGVISLIMVVDITLPAAALPGCLMDLPRRYFENFLSVTLSFHLNY